LESAAYPLIGEHLQKLRNAGSRPEAPFFNSLLIAPDKYDLLVISGSSCRELGGL
jgi:hypothetical protein